MDGRKRLCNVDSPLILMFLIMSMVCFWAHVCVRACVFGWAGCSNDVSAFRCAPQCAAR